MGASASRDLRPVHATGGRDAGERDPVAPFFGLACPLVHNLGLGSHAEQRGRRVEGTGGGGGWGPGGWRTLVDRGCEDTC